FLITADTIYFNIQPVNSSANCNVIKNRDYFPMDMSFCNSFFLSVYREDENTLLAYASNKRNVLG
ncbi:MAG: hypothetical protein ABJB76_09160, partial [Candidatus Nitrosocosmicus sp.]